MKPKIWSFQGGVSILSKLFDFLCRWRWACLGTWDLSYWPLALTWLPTVGVCGEGSVLTHVWESCMISFSCHVLLTVHCQMLSLELRKSAFQASRACGSWGCGQILQAKTGWMEACLPCSPSREMAAEKEVNRGEGSIGETFRNPKMLTVFFSM